MPRNVHPGLTGVETSLSSQVRQRMLLCEVVDRGAIRMRRMNMLGLLAAMIIAAVPAFAFEEQQAGGMPAQTAPAPGIVIDNSRSAAESGITADMEFATPAQTGKTGTEVFIPGLGSLGVLPKMDFGLELLYGATESPTKAPDGSEPSLSYDDDDLKIRGTVKHRF